MSKISVKETRSENKLSFLRVFITVLVFFVVLFICLANFAPGPVSRERGVRIVCMVHLRSMGVSFNLYAEDFDDSLPSVESWCDALDKYMISEHLICPGSNAKEDQSSYAMNEFMNGKKLAELPPDLVLLFESMPGWNKAGGPEILTTEHHEAKGCNVLFVDGHVKFIGADNVSELKWTISENNSDE